MHILTTITLLHLLTPASSAPAHLNITLTAPHITPPQTYSPTPSITPPLPQSILPLLPQQWPYNFFGAARRPGLSTTTTLYDNTSQTALAVVVAPLQWYPRPVIAGAMPVEIPPRIAMTKTRGSDPPVSTSESKVRSETEGMATYLSSVERLTSAHAVATVVSMPEPAFTRMSTRMAGSSSQGAVSITRTGEMPGRSATRKPKDRPGTAGAPLAVTPSSSLEDGN